MTTYQPRSPHSDSIKRPDCPDCGARMDLFGIEPEKPGHELYTFVCPRCAAVQTAVGEAQIS